MNAKYFTDYQITEILESIEETLRSGVEENQYLKITLEVDLDGCWSCESKKMTTTLTNSISIGFRAFLSRIRQGFDVFH